ncbi:MAG: hypothetical protein GY804_08975 [Alphaproteobacteria bacterium]|nr:hypothetical protein [Alphaproteobacteria bacterium]
MKTRKITSVVHRIDGTKAHMFKLLMTGKYMILPMDQCSKLRAWLIHTLLKGIEPEYGDFFNSISERYIDTTEDVTSLQLPDRIKCVFELRKNNKVKAITIPAISYRLGSYEFNHECYFESMAAVDSQIHGYLSRLSRKNLLKDNTEPERCKNPENTYIQWIFINENKLKLNSPKRDFKIIPYDDFWGFRSDEWT